jgi:two-component system sensor kinase FixL
MTSLRQSDAAQQAGRVAEARWRAVINAAIDGIIVIDGRGVIEVFNAAAQRMFGYAEDEALGQNVSLLMPEPDRSQHDAYLARYLRTGERRIVGIGRPVTARRKNGETFPVHLSVGAMEIDGETYFTGIVHDLSGRASLEDRLREATAMARLGEMAAVIAHEVKNPLAAVRGAIQVIGRRMKDAGDAAIVSEIIARLDALSALIQDLLVFSRPAQPKPGPTNLRALVESVSRLLKSDPAFRQLEVTLEGDPPALYADAALLTIVFQNLLINAAQATHGRGAVAVTVTATRGWHRVDVADRGPGIPAEMRGVLFRPFKTTKARGTGLGLATAKQIVDSHNGRISVECPPDGGTVVTVELPSGDPPEVVS